jgi:hypothetical protein
VGIFGGNAASVHWAKQYFAQETGLVIRKTFLKKKKKKNGATLV